MEKAKKITQVVIVLALVGILGYDAYAMMKFGYEATISNFMYVQGHQYPIIPLLIGIVCGHAF